MPTNNQAGVPAEITRTNLTVEQAAFLRRNFSAEAADQGLVASFSETANANGEITLVIRFTRVAHAPLTAVAADSLAWGRRVSAAFRERVRAIAARLGTDPSFLMAVMAFETGRSFRADQKNHAGSGAVGLIQFMPSTAVSLGTTSLQLEAMTPEAQLAFVEQYLLPFSGRIHSVADLYMAVLWPLAVPKPDDFVLFSKSIDPTTYEQNKGLDVAGDGKVTKGEAASRVAALLVEGLLPENAA